MQACLTHGKVAAWEDIFYDNHLKSSSWKGPFARQFLSWLLLEQFNLHVCLMRSCLMSDSGGKIPCWSKFTRHRLPRQLFQRGTFRCRNKRVPLLTSVHLARLPRDLKMAKSLGLFDGRQDDLPQPWNFHPITLHGFHQIQSLRGWSGLEPVQTLNA